MHEELEQKKKIQREYLEKIEREKKQEEEEKIKKDLGDKINKLVVQYNEQSKHCDALLEIYNAEKTKLRKFNAEYEKLKYQLDTYSSKNNYKNNDIFLGVSSILFPFVDLLRK